MRTLLQVIIAVIVSLSVAVPIMPLRASGAQPAGTSCCARGNVEEQQDRCMKHLPKSEQDQRCCAACPVCLAILVDSMPALLTPPAAEDSFAVFSPGGYSRSDRPPVPPPRPSII